MFSGSNGLFRTQLFDSGPFVFSSTHTDQAILALACVHACARDPDAESCQAAGRLISFVFRTASSIYPFPVAERGWGGVRWGGGP